jgi:tripartite-type tricarboxylate transporter receptor subunit TctC
MIGEGPLVLAVSATLPYKSAAELIAAARAKPDTLTYGSAGVGSVGHLATELFDAAAKLQMRHVPYKGAANAAIDLAGGQIQVMISSYSTLSGLIKSGKVRPLAVTSRQPHASFPDMPTLAASVPGFSIDIWVGVFAPAGVPSSLVARLNREINDISPSPELAVLLEPDGTVPVALTAASFALRIKQELAQWKQIAGDRKIVAE